jgi:hypothetical protein
MSSGLASSMPPSSPNKLYMYLMGLLSSGSAVRCGQRYDERARAISTSRKGLGRI